MELIAAWRAELNAGRPGPLAGESGDEDFAATPAEDRIAAAAVTESGDESDDASVEATGPESAPFLASVAPDGRSKRLAVSFMVGVERERLPLGGRHRRDSSTSGVERRLPRS